MLGYRYTFPFRVVAANSRASASAWLADCKMAMVVAQASFYQWGIRVSFSSPRCSDCSGVALGGVSEWGREMKVLTDFWNLAK